MRDVREQLEDLANEGTPRGAAALMQNARRASTSGDRARRHRNVRRGAPAGTALVAVVAVVAVVVVAGGTVATLRDRSNAQAGGAAPRYLLPSSVPAGFQLERTADGEGEIRDGSSEWTRTQRWVRFDASHQRP